MLSGAIDTPEGAAAFYDSGLSTLAHCYLAGVVVGFSDMFDASEGNILRNSHTSTAPHTFRLVLFEYYYLFDEEDLFETLEEVYSVLATQMGGALFREGSRRAWSFERNYGEHLPLFSILPELLEDASLLRMG